MRNPPRSVLALAVLTVLLSAVAGCSAQRGNGDDRLALNLRQWESNRPERYRFTFAHVCFCPIERLVEPVVITVHGDSITDVSPTGDAKVSARLRSRYRTIEGLFDRIRDWRSAGPDSLWMEFHERLGYPTDFFVDPADEYADGESGFRLLKLRGLEAP